MASVTATVPQRGRSAIVLSRNHVGRYAAAACGALALVLFYLPWVGGSVPGSGEHTFTGLDLARGEAAIRADLALTGRSAAGGAAATGASASQAGVNTGGLALPTRMPTVTPPASGQFSTSGTTSSAGSAAAGASLGGLVLPTRIPTVTPPPSGQFSASAATAVSGQLAGGGAANTVLEIGRQVERPREPDRLPKFLLYFVPLAGLGLAAFSVVWDRLYEARDRLFGRVWTTALAYGGALAVGNVLYLSANAPVENDLLGPGRVMTVEWALWGALIAFVFASVSITVAWLSPAPAPPVRYARPAT